MNRVRHPDCYRTVPAPRIQIVQRPDDEHKSRKEILHDGSKPAGHKAADEVTFKRTSLSQEVKEGKVEYRSLPQNTDTISNMEKGTTFSARARAAELNTARAVAAAKVAMDNEEDEIPEVAPVSLGSLVFTKRKSGKRCRMPDPAVNLPDHASITSSTSLDPTPSISLASNSASSPIINSLVHRLDVSEPAPPRSSQDGQQNQTLTESRPNSEVNAQVNQQTSDVSTKPHSIGNSNNYNYYKYHYNQEEAYGQRACGRTSASSHSSQGNRFHQPTVHKKTELNTQHIREIQREVEKKNETANPVTPAAIIFNQHPRADYITNLRPHTHGLSLEQVPEELLVTTSGDTECLQSKSEDSYPNSSRFNPLPIVPLLTEPFFEKDTATRLGNRQITPSNNHQPQVHSPQPLSPAQTLTIDLSNWDENTSKHTLLPNKLSLVGNMYTPPRREYNTSSQESFHPTQNPQSAEDQQRDISSGYPQTTNSVTMADRPDDSQYISIYSPQVAQNGTDMQEHPSNDPRYDTRYQKALHPQNQLRGTENQSLHGQQTRYGHVKPDPSPYGQHNLSVNDQRENRSFSGQQHPKSLDKFTDVEPRPEGVSMGQPSGKVNEDPFTDPARPSTIHRGSQFYPVPSNLKATSPDFKPFGSNLRLDSRPSKTEFTSRGQVKAPLPAVKGTQRDQRFQFQVNHTELLANASGSEQAPLNSFTHPMTARKSLNTQREMGYQGDAVELQFGPTPKNVRTQSQATASPGFNTPNLRDPMPYTGFSSSTTKKDQLLGNLHKTISDEKAKGNLSASNRSVLFDPVASASSTTGAGGSMYDGTASGGRFSFNFYSNLRDPRWKPEAPAFTFPDVPESTRDAPEYDPNILKDSEPLPPAFRQQGIETKPLSSPEEVFDHRDHRRGHSSAAPRDPPGLGQSSDPYLEAQMSNDDGFWNDSLAMNSVNLEIEAQMRKFACDDKGWIAGRTRPSAPKSNDWIEEQMRLLDPKPRDTNEDPEKKAIEWWGGAGKKTINEHVKDVLLRSHGLARISDGTQYWQEEKETPSDQKAQLGAESLHTRKISSSRHAPIGSERRAATHVGTSSQVHGHFTFSIQQRPQQSTSTKPTAPAMSDEEVRTRAAIDIMAPVLSNLQSYAAGTEPGFGQRYADPPAWAVDDSAGGNRSFFDGSWGDVPKRVGRDPRYQQTMHEGRPTYFAEPNPAPRQATPGYTPTLGWGMPNRKL